MSSGTAVSDASPLIIYHQIGYFDLFRSLFQHQEILLAAGEAD